MHMYTYLHCFLTQYPYGLFLFIMTRFQRPAQHQTTTSDFDWLRDLCYYFNYIPVAAILILMSARLAPTELRRRRSPCHRADATYAPFPPTVPAQLARPTHLFLRFHRQNVVPGTFLVSPPLRFQESWCCTLVYRKQAAGHWLVREWRQRTSVTSEPDPRHQVLRRKWIPRRKSQPLSAL